MAGSNSHITILTLNVNGLNAPSKDIDWQTDKETIPISAVYPGNPSHMQGYTKAQNKGMKEDLRSKWRANKSRSCNSHL